jgi:hypothetical protein
MTIGVLDKGNNNNKLKAGLFLVDRNNNVCFIFRHEPYKTNSNSIVTTNADAFLEKIQIPRGNREIGDKDLMSTAIREFSEETLCQNKHVYIYNKPFVLYWTDANSVWSYNIFVGCTDDEMMFSFESKTLKPLYLSVDNNESYFRCWTRPVAKESEDECGRNILIMSLRDYMDYMKKVQLKFYEGQNNYIEFFKYVETLIDWRNDKTVLLRRRPKKKTNEWTSKSIKQLNRRGCVDQNHLRRIWYNWWRSHKKT